MAVADKPRDTFVPKRNGVADLLKARPFPMCVTMPNLVVCHIASDCYAHKGISPREHGKEPQIESQVIPYFSDTTTKII